MKKIIALILIFLLSFSICSCKKSPSDDTSVKEDTSVKKETRPEKKIHAIGELVTLNDWQFTVENADIVQSVEDQFTTFTPQEDTDQFLSLDLKIKNTASERRIFNPSIVQEESADTYATLVCNKKYEYPAILLLGYQNDLYNIVVEPLSTRTGELHFSYPKELGDSTANMLIRFTSGGKTADISLKKNMAAIEKETEKESETETQTEVQNTSKQEDISKAVQTETANVQPSDSPNSPSKSIVGMWEGEWMDGRVEFDFMSNGEFYCTTYYGNDSNTTQGMYWVEQNTLTLDTGESYTIKSLSGNVLKLNTYAGTYSLSRTTV